MLLLFKARRWRVAGGNAALWWIAGRARTPELRWFPARRWHRAALAALLAAPALVVVGVARAEVPEVDNGREVVDADTRPLEGLLVKAVGGFED